MSQIITREEFSQIVATLEGMTITRVWKGWGSRIFFEVGELHSNLAGKPGRFGEFTISSGFCWRVERGARVLFDWAKDNSVLDHEIRALEGLRIERLSLGGSIPDLIVSLDHDIRFRDFSHTRDDVDTSIDVDMGWRVSRHNDWHLQPDGSDITYMSHWDSERSGGSELSLQEEEAIVHANQTSARWERLIPPAHPAGTCRDCIYYIGSQADFELMDYGLCSNAASSYDGRVVSVISGCAEGQWDNETT